MSTSQLERFEGRLFARDGRLHFVVHACEATNIARVSCRIEDERKVIEMPLSEVRQLICSDHDLSLDNVNGNQSAERITRKRDGWYFSAREGLKGPYPSKEDAQKELNAYIVAAQSKSAAR